MKIIIIIMSCIFVSSCGGGSSVKNQNASSISPSYERKTPVVSKALSRTFMRTGVKTLRYSSGRVKKIKVKEYYQITVTSNIKLQLGNSGYNKLLEGVLVIIGKTKVKCVGFFKSDFRNNARMKYASPNDIVILTSVNIDKENGCSPPPLPIANKIIMRVYYTSQETVNMLHTSLRKMIENNY
jgi:hypothetical protein